jgi:dTDP-4-dehydrorhamnose reductase
VVAFTREDGDVADLDAVRDVVGRVQPDVIVHLAAYTAVDRAEDDADAARATNEIGTANLSLVAHECDARLIAVSTDYVFDGTKGTPYVETDETHPLGVYGETKRAGEMQCRPEDTIVRTSWVMGVRGKSVVHVMIDRAMSNQAVRFVNDQTGTVTLASDLAKALIALIRTTPGGIWHVANAGVATWHDVAAFVGECCGRDESFATAIATSDLDPQPRVTRPAFSALDTSKFAGAYGALPDWHEGVARLVAARRELQ